MSVIVTLPTRNLRLHSVTLFLASLCLPGCWLVGGSPTAPQPSHAPVRRLSAHSIQENSRYQEAVRAFALGDRAGALRLLEALRLTPGLSAADLAFLDRQVALCQSKPPNTSPPQPPSPKGKGGVLGTGDCGPRALELAAKALGVTAELAALTKAAGTTKDGTSLAGLVKAAKSVGLKAQGVQVDRDALAQLPTPAIAWWEGNHFVAVLKISENAFTGEVSGIVHDPNHEKPESMSLADLLAKSGGIILTLKK